MIARRLRPVGCVFIVAAFATACSVPVDQTNDDRPTPTTHAVVTSTPAPSTSAPAATLPVGPGAQATYKVQGMPPAGSCHYGGNGYPLPDPSCTPGATNPGVTQAVIATTICARGWTSTIRPPQAITGPEKRASARSYGYSGSFATAELDHLVPLELGGDPNDARNLWLEPNDIAGAKTFNNTKDTVENAARSAVCGGRLSLAEAQSAIAMNWPQLGRRLGVTQ